MELHLNRLEAGPLELEFSLQPDRLERAHLKGPLTCWVRLEPHREQVKLKGRYSAELSLPCDACTQPTDLKASGEFELILVPQEEEADLPEDLELSLESLDMDYYQGNTLNLGPYFEDQLILDLPFRVLCSEDCKGLCGKCGADLNQGPCGCEQVNENSPFALLKDWQPSKDA